MSPLGSFDVLHAEISTIFPLRKIKSSTSFRKEIISNFVGLTIINPITGYITRESMITSFSCASILDSFISHWP